jgi:hypothetical protein
MVDARAGLDEVGGPAPEASAPASAGEIPPPRNGRKSGSRDPKVFVLLRELSEVHLLLENVSANPNTTVSDLSAGTLPAELDRDWIEKVCQISWPPDGSNEEKAEDAALLIRAKDYLNRLSRPASGSTIAFTLLVTQQDTRKGPSERGKAHGAGEPSASPTRSSLAQTAYPDLIGKAIGFRRWMMGIGIGLLIALLLTCALSWYVAYGNAGLAELATVRANLAETQNRINEAEAAEAARIRESADETAVQTDGVAAAATSDPPFVGYCDREFYTNASQAQLCAARLRSEANLTRVQNRLQRWLCSAPFNDCAAGSAPGTGTADKAGDAPARAAAFAAIMGSAVLPFLYGLLGAGAAIIRSLSRKIRASLLSPRDLHLSFQQLALGAVVGACIGLFVAAPGADASGEGLLGPVALSASAISFVAGFGVEGVFQALEALIARIFNVAPTPAGNRGDGLPGN